MTARTRARRSTGSGSTLDEAELFELAELTTDGRLVGLEAVDDLTGRCHGAVGERCEHAIAERLQIGVHRCGRFTPVHADAGEEGPEILLETRDRGIPI